LVSMTMAFLANVAVSVMFLLGSDNPICM